MYEGLWAKRPDRVLRCLLQPYRYSGSVNRRGTPPADTAARAENLVANLNASHVTREDVYMPVCRTLPPIDAYVYIYIICDIYIFILMFIVMLIVVSLLVYIDTHIATVEP